MTEIALHRQPDGTLIDWGRNWRIFGRQGVGGARWYSGEALELMNLVLKHTKGAHNDRD